MWKTHHDRAEGDFIRRLRRAEAEIEFLEPYLANASRHCVAFMAHTSDRILSILTGCKIDLMADCMIAFLAEHSLGKSTTKLDKATECLAEARAGGATRNSSGALAALRRMRCDLCSSVALLWEVLEHVFNVSPADSGRQEDVWGDWQDTGGEGG
jgi:hypothetical protein